MNTRCESLYILYYMYPHSVRQQHNLKKRAIHPANKILKCVMNVQSVHHERESDGTTVCRTVDISRLPACLPNIPQQYTTHTDMSTAACHTDNKHINLRHTSHVY